MDLSFDETSVQEYIASCFDLKTFGVGNQPLWIDSIWFALISQYGQPIVAIAGVRKAPTSSQAGWYKGLLIIPKNIGEKTNAFLGSGTPIDIPYPCPLVEALHNVDLIPEVDIFADVSFSLRIENTDQWHYRIQIVTNYTKSQVTNNSKQNNPPMRKAIIDMFHLLAEHCDDAEILEYIRNNPRLIT